MAYPKKAMLWIMGMYETHIRWGLYREGDWLKPVRCEYTYCANYSVEPALGDH